MKSLCAIIIAILSAISGIAQPSNKTKADSFVKLAWEASQNNYYKKCLKLVDSALKYDSGNSWSYSIKAEAHWLIGQYMEAAKAHKKAMFLTKDSLLIGAFVLQGMLYDKANMPDSANEEYTMAIKLWEQGHAPYKQLLKDQHVDYVFAVGLIGNLRNWNEQVHQLVRKYPDRNYLSLIDKSKSEILDFYFNSQFALPNGIKPLE